jgi:hypothetical protein
MKQTAVEWLENQLETYGDSGYCKIEWETLDELFEQAKEMEKEQIMQSYNDGKSAVIHIEQNKSLDQYYNETYKSE